MDLKWRPQNLPLTNSCSGISAPVMFCCVFALIQIGTGQPILNITIFMYVPSTAVPLTNFHFLLWHQQHSLLLPQGVFLPLGKRNIFFSGSSSRLISEILQTCPHWHKYYPVIFFLFFPIVSSRSQVRYTYTKKTHMLLFLSREGKDRPRCWLLCFHCLSLIFAIS